jgi:cytochrome b pre-mRNA-processing protein 3
MQFLTKFSSQRRAKRQIARQLYDTLLKQALNVDLYDEGLAVDTFEGRFEQLALHGALMLRILREKGDRSLAEALSDAIFAGVDHAHRERGAGDSSISRKVRKSGEVFYGLARGLDQALKEDGDIEMRTFVVRNGLAKGHEGALISYLRCADEALRQVSNLELVVWPKV